MNDVEFWCHEVGVGGWRVENFKEWWTGIVVYRVYRRLGVFRRPMVFEIRYNKNISEKGGRKQWKK